MSTFFFDSNSEVFYTVARELKLENYIRMPYIIKDEQYYYDLGEKYDSKWFLGLIKEGYMPTTAALNAEDYKEYFRPFFEKGEDILYVSFSSAMSGTFESMDIAVKELSAEFPKAKFTRFNTKGITMSAGISVIEAAKMFNAGATNEQIVEFLEKFHQRVNSYIYVDDLNFLKRGGRLSAGQAFFGSLLKIKPIIKLDKAGKLNVYEKVNGTKKAWLTIANQTIADARDVESYPIYVMETGNEEGAEFVKSKIAEALPKAKIIMQKIGPVITTHCGPGALGTCFVGEKRPDSI
ncbi:MAG: DegV family protein [Christensenellales bacterium]|jgi:DegV family protein with EDD domain